MHENYNGKFKALINAIIEGKDHNKEDLAFIKAKDAKEAAAEELNKATESLAENRDMEEFNGAKEDYNSKLQALVNAIKRNYAKSR